MGIENISDSILLVSLPAEEPHIADEIRHINEVVTERCDCNVIVDFTGVELITSSTISNLIILHRLLLKQERKLVLSNVAFVTKCIFTVAGLDKVFEFTDDHPAAVAAIESQR
ncbi:MAG: STAS domain-containing protein [Planctomycetota bacterium]|jgi:anti-anti-sigma regulatory factor